MALTNGSRLGPYEIVAAAGAGGMGEVYRARDPRLERHVALKVLTSRFVADADGLRRFQQEAQAASQLNHPNIVAVYDVGQHDGVPYLVSELLEGETLRQRLTRERLPLRRALDLAIQIARGLAAAHEKGIIHRDLKPENIFITRDGNAKILDFGLAKLLPTPDDAEKGTAPTAYTEAGVMLGTAGYMSPEQARGLPTDHRTDIFSLGAVLYEMVAARRAFVGETAADIITKVLTADPTPPSEGNDRLPPALDRVILHALEKNPAERFQAVRDLGFVLEGLTTASGASTPAVAGVPQRRWRPAAGILLVLAAALLVYVLWRRESGPPRSEASAPIVLQRLTDFVGMEQSPAVSPDGKSVALSAGTGTPHIWVRLLAGGAPLRITRDHVPHLYPRWSPDSASLIYFSPAAAESEAQGAIYEISALGGNPRRLVTSFTGGDISHDEKRLAFFRREGNRLELVIADRNGVNASVLASLAPDFGYCCLRWSPGDQMIGYQRSRVFNYDVFAIAVNGGEPRKITRDQTSVAGYSWLPDASGIVYSSSRNTTALYLPTMDLFQAKLDGSPVRQLTFGDTSYLDPDVCSEGRVFATQVRRDFDVWKFPIDGSPADNVRRAVRVTNQTGHVQTPSLSPTIGPWCSCQSPAGIRISG